MRPILDDLRRALRSLLQTPGFTAIAVLILALGIGANAAIFSLVDRVLLQPLPFPDSGRLVAVWGAVPVRDRSDNPLSAPDFLDWQRDAGQLEGMAALANDSLNLTGDLEPEDVPTARVSWNFFRVVGVHPALGRDFTPEEDRAEGPKAVILSHEFWTKRFGADPGLVGRSIRLSGLDTTVVGIMPKGFRFTHRIGGTSILVPIAFSREQLDQRGSHFLGAVGRLKPGASAASCEADLKRVAAGLASAYPDSNRNFTARVVPLKEQMVVNARGTLLVLTGAVAFVLLIACANLMNLMLARSARRQREMAIRAALGAGPGALVWSALAESLVLGLMGGAAGLFLGRWTLNGLVAVLGSSRIGIERMPLDARVLLFTLALSLAASLLFGLLPALNAERLHLADSLKEGKGTGTASHPRLRGLLVASETALATALLIGAGLMLRSLIHLQSVDPGFRPDHVLVARISLPRYKYPDVNVRNAFMGELQRKLEATQGIAAVGINDTPPLLGSTSSSSYDVGGEETVDGQEALNHHITPGYFKAMGIPVLQGRDIAPNEAGTMLVNEAFARKHFPRGNALEGRVSMDRREEPFLSIVGVVGDVRHSSLAQGARPEMYFPMASLTGEGFPIPSFLVVLRTVPDPAGMIPVLKRVLHEVDPDLPLGRPRTMETVLNQDRQEAQARSILLGSFAGLALLLAAVGIYAVVTFLTAQRTREIGVRMAMGAQVRDVLTLVVGQGLRMALAGIAGGVVISLAMGRVLDAQIAGVRSWDPATFALVAGLLALVGAAACLLPALRAARVDPMVALRNE
ncbi:ABC transporter permease [Mesoterricola silvestris]|uniref:ABC transporter permease n=1 Tax=Mesoterricola silvestris TaxID=2927979 RepID=A0AA48GMQ8_9BACT|nr:ABC transporter permease [Mesoterricola silvestris]BDU74262.1 hypothetical protein METEAL_34360 [Mesoterricola silvestris]